MSGALGLYVAVLLYDVALAAGKAEITILSHMYTWVLCEPSKGVSKGKGVRLALSW